MMATTNHTLQRDHRPPSSTEERLVSDLIALMEQGGSPWRRPWRQEGGRHVNLCSGRAYRGANPVLLTLGMELRGSALPFWCGWGEARRLGVAPRRGSRGVTILRPLPLGGSQERGDGAAGGAQTAADPPPGALDAQERDGEGSPGDTSWAAAGRGAGVRWRPLVVFNAADLVGEAEASRALGERIQRCLAAARSSMPPSGERLARAEKTLGAWPVAVLEGGNRACYVPASDRIHLPDAPAFSSSAARLATWAHEAIHSTGHPSRLGRDLLAPFGSDAYAREELVAELGAVLVGERLAIGSDTANHAAYLEHWCALLRESPRLLLRLLAEARRAADLIAPEAAPAKEASANDEAP
ncbi:MAG: zincin-like metallopeptidase domain-containing protein [Cyanobium sp.]